jgi:hypothetical protein
MPGIVESGRRKEISCLTDDDVIVTEMAAHIIREHSRNDAACVGGRSFRSGRGRSRNGSGRISSTHRIAESRRRAIFSSPTVGREPVVQGGDFWKIWIIRHSIGHTGGNYGGEEVEFNRDLLRRARGLSIARHPRGAPHLKEPDGKVVFPKWSFDKGN